MSKRSKNHNSTEYSASQKTNVPVELSVGDGDTFRSQNNLGKKEKSYCGYTLCSVCGNRVHAPSEANFCPHCGIKFM